MLNVAYHKIGVRTLPIPNTYTVSDISNEIILGSANNSGEHTLLNLYTLESPTRRRHRLNCFKTTLSIPSKKGIYIYQHSRRRLRSTKTEIYLVRQYHNAKRLGNGNVFKENRRHTFFDHHRNSQDLNQE